MEEKYRKIDKKRANVTKVLVVTKPLPSLLMTVATESYRYDKIEEYFLKKYNALFSRKTLNDALNPSFRDALTILTCKKYADLMIGSYHKMIGHQISKSYDRRSQRSLDPLFYFRQISKAVGHDISLYYVEGALKAIKDDDIEFWSNSPNLLSLKINHHERKIIKDINDILDGNSDVLINHGIIEAILISEDETLKDKLLQLLKTAQLQEGLRQSILEKADSGDFQTFVKICSICEEEDLFRFSSATRAFFTWCGFVNEKIDSRKIKKNTDVALKCLYDNDYRLSCFSSTNPLEIYFGLWAMGNIEYKKSLEWANQLICSDNRMAKMVGWFYIHQCQSEEIKHRFVFEHLDEQDPEILAYIGDCIYIRWVMDNMDITCLYPDLKKALFIDKNAKIEEIYKQLLKICVSNSKAITYSPSLFPFYTVHFDPSLFNSLLLEFNKKLINGKLMKRLNDNIEYLDSWHRMDYYRTKLDPKKGIDNIKCLYSHLNDKSLENRIELLGMLKNYTNVWMDDSVILSLSKSSSEKIRRAVYELLEKTPDYKKQYFIEQLSQGIEMQKQLAIELLNNDKDLKEANKELVLNLSQGSQSQQSLLLSKQLLEESPEFSEKNGYGIYDPSVVSETYKKFEAEEKLQFIKPSNKTIINNSLNCRQLLNLSQIREFLPKPSLIKEMMTCMVAFIEEHKDYQYRTTTWNGAIENCLFGDTKEYGYGYSAGFRKEYRGKDEPENPATIDGIPFAKEMIARIGKIENRPDQLVMAIYMLEIYPWYFDAENRTKQQRFNNKIVREIFANSRLDEYKQYREKLKELLNLMIDKNSIAICNSTMTQLYFSLIGLLSLKELKEPIEDRYSRPRCRYTSELDIFEYAREKIKSTEMNDEQFKFYFVQMYLLDKKLDIVHLKGEEYLRAIDLGILNKDCYFERILNDDVRSYNNSLEWLTGYRYKYEKFNSSYPRLRLELADEITTKMVRFECRRGQKDTPISDVLFRVKALEGTENFALLYKAIGGEKLSRYDGYFASTKGELLSSLLRKCFPRKTDNVELLKKELADDKYNEKRLVQVAMYAPQWAKIIGELIGWTDLNKAVWFFHAHMNEYVSNTYKETEVGHYSPISLQRFCDGAFDPSWYSQIEAELSGNQMKMLYDSAKYITNGSNAHRRVQLYVDALCNHLDIEETEKEIKDKRNKERLCAYALIPLRESEDEDLIRRYDFICAFEKESKMFGSLRRASEKKAVQCALDNLAINCGLFDVNLMMWRLERKKAEYLQPYFNGVQIGKYVLNLEIDDKADCSLKIYKDSKQLKTVPKELSADTLFMEIKGAQKELKEQKKRNRDTLEDAMINQFGFKGEDFGNMFASPVLSHMIDKLVWCDDEGRFGFIRWNDSRLSMESLSGKSILIEHGKILRIAHPHDLAQSLEWSGYMRLLFDQKIVQPFKQVFREYYPLSPQERESKTKSTRYAGTQVQKNKMLGLLRNKGWLVDYEEGLQKVFYRQDIIAHIYCYADWFTPGDIEEPTMEDIYFSQRGSFDAMELENINPILFSEVMRDLDLVVSCAYVGKIDPQVSQSTIEMRISVAKELSRLLKLTNVEFDGHFAKIEGKLSQYRIHMGSGTVNTFDKGVLPVFPVFSQQRGHIFLPFADEDPKTAQILSEILTFAQDDKLKDPTILQWLK